MLIANVSIPVMTAATGWIVSSLITRILFVPKRPFGVGALKVQGIIPKYYDRMKGELAVLLEDKLASMDNLFGNSEQEMVMTEEIDKVFTTVLDGFVTSLREEMPTLTMFFNNSIEYTFKDMAKKQLIKQLPSIMNTVTPELLKGDRIRQFVDRSLSECSLETFEHSVRQRFAKELRLVKFLGLGVGAFVGMIEFALLVYLRGM